MCGAGVEAAASTFSGSIVRAPSRDKGLPKVLCQRTSRFVHLCRQYSPVDGSLGNHLGLTNGRRPCTTAFALTLGRLGDRRLSRLRLLYSLLFRGGFHTPWLGEACLVRAFAVANEMDSGVVLGRMKKGSNTLSYFGSKSSASQIFH